MKLILEGLIQNGGTTPPPTGYIAGDCAKTGDTAFMDTHDCYTMDAGGTTVCFFKEITSTPPTTASTATTATTSGLTLPDLSNLITNAWGKITSWFGKVIFLGKAWDCDNEGGTPPCFKKLSAGKYDSEKEAYIEEYFEELNDAGVYEYYCNGSVAFSPYYESDATGGYVESGRPKIWYKWDPKTGVINKS